MAGRKTENQNGLKYKIERKPQGNIEIPVVFAYDIVAASKKRLQSCNLTEYLTKRTF